MVRVSAQCVVHSGPLPPPSLQSPHVHMFGAALISVLIIGMKRKGALTRWDDTVNTRLYSPSLSIPPSLHPALSEKAPLSAFTNVPKTQKRVQTDQTARPFKTRRAAKEALTPTLGFQSRTKKRKLLRALPPLLLPPLFHQNDRRKKYINIYI